ncbi:uncharacterized protein DS421_2g49620 [Arachis hypogaea]|nr:uncharacterized protein DS421_2g49620 [Arachis hypogaea]
MTMSLNYLSSSMDPMNLNSKSDLLRPVVVVAISLLLCPIISMTTLSTTLIASFSFFFEPMFNNRFSFHMSGNGDIARCTDSLDVRSKLSANLDSRKEGMKHSSGERCALRVVVKLGLEDIVDVVSIGGDVIENVEVDASVATRVAITPWLNLGTKEEEGKDEKEDYKGEEGEYEC